MSIYTIIFDDDTVYQGGEDYLNSKWKDIPKDKKIRSVFYIVPFADVIYLSGYDKYYHMVEVITDLNGKDAGKTIIDFIYLIGKKDNICRIYKMDLKNKKIEILLEKEDSKYIKSLNSMYWRG